MGKNKKTGKVSPYPYPSTCYPPPRPPAPVTPYLATNPYSYHPPQSPYSPDYPYRPPNYPPRSPYSSDYPCRSPYSPDYPCQSPYSPDCPPRSSYSPDYHPYPGLDAVVTNGNDNGLDLRNYVFYSDPLSRDNLNSRSPHNKKNHHGSVESADSSSSSSKRTSSASIGRTSSPSAPLVAGKNNTHKNNADYAAVIEEGGIESSHHHHPTIRPESSYYTRMALEEAEAKESMPSVLHNPKIRIQLASMKHHRPWFLGIMTIIQVACLIGSCVINWKTTGSPIQLVPFNYMIGPGSGVLITMGARWVPCMRSGTGLENYPSIECPVGIQGSVASANNNDPATCTLSDICGFGGVDNAHPNQWYRFLTAMGLHGGLLHLLFNLSFQVRTGFQMEKDFGWWRIAMIYFLSGIAGFVFGANFNPMTPSVGCSGALYGLMACLLLDLFQNWRLINKPWLELFKMGIQILISLLIGMLPFIDNFAHIGGFYTGILAGLLFMPTIHFGTWDKWRKRVLMLGALPALVVILVFLFKGFYGSAPECTWCKYLNCIPGLPWCEDKWNTAAITAAPQR